MGTLATFGSMRVGECLVHYIWVMLDVAVYHVPPTATVCPSCVSSPAGLHMFYQVLLCNLKIRVTHWSSAGMT